MKILRKALFLVLAGLLGLLLGGLGARHGIGAAKAVHWSRGQKFGLLAFLPLAWLLAVLAHELGHVLMGRAKGFVFQWLAVGPFRWKKEAGHLRFSWNKDLNTAGGMALCVPPDSHDLRRRTMAFALGGPLASLVFAAFALGLYALLPAPATELLRMLRAGLALSGAISAALVLATLLPMHAGGFYSDGARALNLWRNGPAGQLELAMLSALVPSMAGTRPRDLPRDLLDIAAQLPDELPFKPYLFHYLYLICLDAGQTEQAAHFLNEYRERLALVPEALRGNVWLESAFFAAAYQHDLPAAQAFFDQYTPSAYIPADVLARAEAALARAAGNTELARTQAQLALQKLPKNLDKGSARLYAEWLTETVAWANQPAVAQG